jgi:hypothetical protein
MKSWNVYTTYYRTRSIFRIGPLDNTVLIMKGISIDEIKATTRFCRTSVSHTNAEDHIHSQNFNHFWYGAFTSQDGFMVAKIYLLLGPLLDRR